MLEVADETIRTVIEQVGRRWREVDSLLPDPALHGRGPVPDGGASAGGEFIVAGPSAFGVCDHWSPEPDSLELSWGAALRFRLMPMVAGPDVAASLDSLLARWREHLAEVPEASKDDTSAVVHWPSRDVEGIMALFRHGFMPLDTLAVRTTPVPANGAEAVSDVRIRRAGPSDLDAVARLSAEVIQFAAHFGSAVIRRGTAAAMRRECADMLAPAVPWTWLAETDGEAVGVLCAQGPDAVSWIAPMVRSAPVAYNDLTAVLPGHRSGGVGAALTAVLHREVEAAAIPVTLLHYDQMNPLSVPFWNRQGYRPLWTTWEAKPARSMR